MSATVVTFGEIMLRLSPPGFERLLQSPMLCATFGGGEANVAVSLAQFGLDSHYVTRLPAHAIGDAAVRALRAEGVRPMPSFAAAAAWASTSRRPAPASAPRPSLRPRALRDQRDSAGRGRLGPRDEGRGVVSRHRHHARARRQGGRGDDGRRRRGKARRRARQRRPELPQEAVDRGPGAGGRCGR